MEQSSSHEALAGRATLTDGGTMLLSKSLWEVCLMCDRTFRHNQFDSQLLLTLVNSARKSKEAENNRLEHAFNSCLETVPPFKQASLEQDESEVRRCRQNLINSFWTVRGTLNRERPSAASWHDRRRQALLERHPDVKKLIGDDILTPIMTVVLVLAHLAVALSVQHVPAQYQFLSAFVAAAVFGGFCAFGFQALDHELSHTTATPGATVLGLAGASCTAVPWFSYYFAGGHAMHHRLAGTPRDVDREAFFWAWERAPARLDFPLGSFLWASAVAMFLPLMYMYSLGVSLLGSWRRNVKELGYCIAEFACTCALHIFVGYYAGRNAVWYLIFSMAFGNGFLLHPLIGFWILQHLCRAKSVDDSTMTLQPTVSYVGSPLWNLLNFNQLSHVEHHDFSRIPWTRLPHLAALAPEFYTSPEMYTCSSIFGLIRAWVMTEGDKFSFGCVTEQIPQGKEE
eukprot:TRINITY_DN24766_c0_g1_i5.p1 TRINITY_DN24766_c0_g1~~TRINITY_DN24766_c0_g1_i5.p1  ORF type:complete len:478 (-),score=58.26 TRINITY_DN24766_c0_g1_i5:128-1492(-)